MALTQGQGRPYHQATPRAGLAIVALLGTQLAAKGPLVSMRRSMYGSAGQGRALLNVSPTCSDLPNAPHPLPLSLFTARVMPVSFRLTTANEHAAVYRCMSRREDRDVWRGVLG